VGDTMKLRVHLVGRAVVEEENGALPTN